MIDSIENFLYAFFINFFIAVIFIGLISGIAWLIITYTSGWMTLVSSAVGIAFIVSIREGIRYVTQ